MASVAPCATLYAADVRALRRRFGLTCAQFAAVFQLSPSTVWRWEGSGAAVAAHRDVVTWLAAMAMMPPEVFEPIRVRVHQVFAVGPWPPAWGIWTIVNAR